MSVAEKIFPSKMVEKWVSPADRLRDRRSSPVHRSRLRWVTQGLSRWGTCSGCLITTGGCPFARDSKSTDSFKEAVSNARENPFWALRASVVPESYPHRRNHSAGNYSLHRRFAVPVNLTRRRSGGALLGDRIRMNSVSAPNVFMRSMATRTANTSVSASVKDSIHALQAAGFDLVILETAGIGQSGSEVVDLSDLSLYVMTPEFGAPSQLEKIDMLDFADLVALNLGWARSSSLECCMTNGPNPVHQWW